MHINKILEKSIRKNWEELAMSDFNGISLQYRDVARKVAKLHLLFENAGIAKGDKIALCGKNSTQWAVAFIAILTYGAVPVPVLHEFKPDNIHHIINHSESKLLFVDATIWENLDIEKIPNICGAIRIPDYSLLESKSDNLTNARKTLNALFGQRPRKTQIPRSRRRTHLYASACSYVRAFYRDASPDCQGVSHSLPHKGTFA